MGLCEGCPRSILPDYMGRADYLGDSVNQAARFMDAGEGAQGGHQLLRGSCMQMGVQEQVREAQGIDHLCKVRGCR